MNNLSNEEIKQMVNRFLGWKLPEDFNPDAGIKFEKPTSPNLHPIGTNLFTATQIEEMIRFITDSPTNEEKTEL